MNLKVSLILAKYRAESRNKIRANIANRTPRAMVKEEWKAFKDKMVETVDKILRKKITHQKPWISVDHTLTLVDKRKHIRLQLEDTTDIPRKQQLMQQHKTLKSDIRKACRKV